MNVKTVVALSVLSASAVTVGVRLAFPGRADSDHGLLLDDQHWGARFSKAMSYTFWPEFTGKRGEAIKQFETLVAQQETMPVEEHQAQTYLYLGNMLAERDPERARSIWRKGLRRHPDNAELRARRAQ
ncbi:MAG TPA: hypothetical protein ENI87_05250 [bacterium]|nr:hypothetical protein [bacterium]